jgi:putative salt-induced outer membrane protein YdiY
MNRTMHTMFALIALLIVFQLTAGTARAEEEDRAWSDVAEFSWVQTAGNSETSTFGFKNTLARSWEKSSFTFKAGGIRAEATTKTYTASGVDPVVFEITEATTTSAENYYLNGRYDRKITDRFFWYSGAGWDRNIPAGISNRYMAIAGVGNIWFDGDDMKFRTDYALTYTDQEDEAEQAGVDYSFLGARFSWEYLNKFSENTTYENLLVLDFNLEETSDYRADMINSVAVAMNSHLALKVSLQWLYDNRPSFINVVRLDPPPDTAAFELDSLDTQFIASLVVNF